MDCVVPRENLKVLRKCLFTLSKIGDELYMEAYKDNLTLTTLKQNRTESACFNFSSSFFSSYDIDLSSVSSEVPEDKEKEALTFKVHMKIVLPLFKRSLESQLDFLKFEYENSKTFILIKMKYRKDGITMIHELKLMNFETITISNDVNVDFCHFTSCCSCYNRLVLMFKSSDEEITLNISPDKVVARNYCPGEPSKPHMVRSHMTFNPTDFTDFSVDTESSINFSLKPLMTLIHFAENFKLDIQFMFKNGGHPLTLKVKTATFEVIFVVATVDENSDGNSSISRLNCTPPLNTIDNNNGELTKKRKRDIFVDGKDSSSVSLKSPIIARKDVDGFLTEIGRHVFARAFEPPYDHEAHILSLGPVLAPNSDSE